MEQVKTLGQERTYSKIEIEEKLIYSEFLEREVKVDVYLPTKRRSHDPRSLLLFNDGQDLRTLNFAFMLNQLSRDVNVGSLMCVGIHCGVDRLNEYGTAYRADYLGRGAKAGRYNKFVLEELLPYLESEYNRRFKEKSFAGFSLGGLSALDIVWNNVQEFAKVGVFSASLWWRRKGYEDGYDNSKDRIMHLQVQKGRHHPGLHFYFQTGRLDETADRNNNGVIDSIEDTTDLINDMKAIGYSDWQIQYREIEDGEHTIQTWARALPDFLKWGWGRKSREKLSQKIKR
jgi:enterochelin esterase-like enzyme